MPSLIEHTGNLGEAPTKLALALGAEVVAVTAQKESARPVEDGHLRPQSAPGQRYQGLCLPKLHAVHHSCTVCLTSSQSSPIPLLWR